MLRISSWHRFIAVFMLLIGFLLVFSSTTYAASLKGQIVYYPPKPLVSISHLTVRHYHGKVRYDRATNIWAGFYTGTGQGNGFKAAQGNWNIPCYSPPVDNNHQEGSWVGISGVFGSNNLLQTGVALRPNGTYQFFYEAFPANPVFQSFTYHCGDPIYARVSYKDTGDNSNGAFSIVEDTKNGQSLLASSRQYGSFQPNLESADWIDERPGCGNGNYTDLANFHYTQWSKSQAKVNANGTGWETIASYVNTLTYTYDANKTIGQPGYTVAEPTTLNGDGQSYTDYWYTAGTDGTC